MRIHYEKRDKVIITRVSGSLTGKSVADLERQLLGEVKSENEPVVLDLSDLDYISSSGIGAVVKLFRDLQGCNSSMAIVSASPRVRMLFELSGLTELVPFMERTSDAINSFAK